MKIKNTSLKLVKGDITDLATDAIVNAANTALQLGGGVAGPLDGREDPESKKSATE